MKKVIALIDGSIYSHSVCDHAAWVMGRTDAAMEIVHVLGRRGVGGPPANLSGNIGLGARSALLQELADLDAQRAKLAQKVGRAVLEDARDRLLGAGIERVTTRLRNGDVIETVQEMEKDADLIVIGKRGEAADFARLHLGSNLERVVRASHKPILVAARAFRPINRVLIAFDGGASAIKAVEHIADGRLLDGLPLHLLHVGPDTGEIRKSLERAVDRLAAAGFAVDSETVAGQPDTVIPQIIASRQIDLLAMGAYGHSRIRSLIIGSTTTEMIRSCLVPVMLFR